MRRRRCTAISLARRADRWAACERHLRAIEMPADLTLDMFAGSDAKAACEGAVGDARIDELEAALDCRIYRDWPITEVADVRRCFPDLTHASDAEAWIGYVKACAACFRPDRARLYVDFFFRHLAT